MGARSNSSRTRSCRHVLCTDIERDGALTGPNVRAVSRGRAPLSADRVAGLRRRPRCDAICRRWPQAGAAAAISGKALLEELHSRRGVASHSCQTHNSLSRRPRRAGRQGRALSRSSGRRRHPGARRALSRRGRGRTRVLRHLREPRGTLGGSLLGRARGARPGHSILRGRRHPLGRARPRQVLAAGAEKISVNSPALARPGIDRRAERALRRAMRRGRHRQPDHGAGLSRAAVHRRCGAQPRHRAQHARLGRRGAAARCRRDRAQLHGERRRAPRLSTSTQLRAVRAVCQVPLVASGGAGAAEHFAEVFQAAGVDAALAASVFHSGEIEIPDLKRELRSAGIEVRPD